VLASRDLLPLGQLVQIVNKVSQNLHAEIPSAKWRSPGTGIGLVSNGINKEREAAWSEAGIIRKGHRDLVLPMGRALSRGDLTTPNSTAVTCPLRGGGARNVRCSLESLYRLERGWLARASAVSASAGLQRVYAKTGSLSHVNALSGYLQQNGRTVAFSIMVTERSVLESAVRQFSDRLCAVSGSMSWTSCRLSSRETGIQSSQIDLWLDNTEPCSATWISHGHSDHARGCHGR